MTLTIREEVAEQHSRLVSRLAGALSTPPPSIPSSSLPTVPLIDLSPSLVAQSTLSARKAVAAKIRSACLSTGFFQIKNHGIPDSACFGVLRQAERFFHELDQSKKDDLHIKHSRLFRGYEPGGSTYVNPDDAKTTSKARDSLPDEVIADGKTPKESDASNTTTFDNGEALNDDDPSAETKEGFNFGYETALDPTGGDGQYVELDGTVPTVTNPSNVWPSETDLSGFKRGVAEYYGHVLSLARHLFRLFALSLELDEDHFDELTTHPGGIARLLYYPSSSAATQNSRTTPSTSVAKALDQQTNPGEKKNSKLGLGAHTDYECFTLLLSTPHPGLEILFPPSPLTDNKPIWLPCPVRPGTLTVNVADFFMRWTNDLYKSTIHRVITSNTTRPRPNNSNEASIGERYSVPFFFSINYDAEVEPLSEEKVGQSKYGRMKAGEYVLERLRATAPTG